MLFRTLRRRPWESCLVITLVLLLYFYHGRIIINDHPSPLPTPVDLSNQNLSLKEIPRNIWQVFLGYSPFDRLGETVQSWVMANQDYSYMLVSKEGAENFVREYYSERPDIVQTFIDIRYPIFQSDLLRYMLLEAKGGVYSDIDTTVRKPIRDWIPTHLVPKTRAVVGIEYDQLDNPGPSHGFSERISFCQWTLAASPGHPMMAHIVEEVVDTLQNMARKNHSTIADLKVHDNQVGDVTGPGIWTRIVMQSLSAATNTRVTYRNVTGLKEPRLFGDILILPIDGFGTGQAHSGSSHNDPDTALVRHHFKMSWRHEPWSK